MSAIRIDVSKGKNMMAAPHPKGEIALPALMDLHTSLGLEQMASSHLRGVLLQLWRPWNAIMSR